MEIKVNEKPKGVRNFSEKDPEQGVHYELKKDGHKADGSVYVGNPEGDLVNHATGKFFMRSRGFDGDRDFFRRVEPVKFEFNVI